MRICSSRAIENMLSTTNISDFHQSNLIYSARDFLTNQVNEAALAESVSCSFYGGLRSVVVNESVHCDGRIHCSKEHAQFCFVWASIIHFFFLQEKYLWFNDL